MAAKPSYLPVESAAAAAARAPKRNPRPDSPESKFWRSFKSSELSSGHILPVPSLDFSPSHPHDLAFAASTAINVYDGSSLRPRDHSPLPPFTDIARSPSFRCDGALLAAGAGDGVVKVFDPSRARAALRTLRAHLRPVHLVRYPKTLDRLHLLSGGDDALLCYWDVAAEVALLSVPGAHRDYIRAGCASPLSSEVFATGSYDHSVKIWDVRASPEKRLLSSLDHGDPVESVLFLPSGGLLATAGGNHIKVWDLIGGGRVVHSMESHNKTVTSLCLGRIGDENDGGEMRILSVSIDGYLKVFDFMALKITHSMRYPAPLLSVGFSPAGSVWAVGTSKGNVFVAKKKAKKQVAGSKIVSEFDGFSVEPRKSVLRPTNYRYFHRGKSEKPAEDDHVIKRVRRVKLAEHDKLLKKFMHREALVSSLTRKNPSSIVAVMEELVARKKLLKCVENMDLDELGLLLGFLRKYMTMPRYARFLIGLASKVLELRSEDIHSSDELQTHVRNLKRMIAEEIRIQHSLQEIQGMIAPLIVVAGK